MTKTIEVGSEVIMHFTIKLTDNTVAQTTTKGEPSKFTMDDESLKDPVESQLIGLKAGETKKIELTPEQAYGFPNPENFHTFPKSQFPSEVEPQAGDIFNFDQPDGNGVPGLITAVEGDEITVDFNHPLSGKTLLIEVSILRVS